uniref:Peptidase M28 domain-containing protein n=1 Tax=Eutreptiella gymnastica TaxID=73025 RepID=A0A7S4GDK0_9EUGL
MDLIGAADGQYISWFPDTHGYHLQLADSEAAFRSQGLLKRDHKYFHKSYYQAGIEDDHTPFLERGVPILHLIPYPFPREWHKPGDTGEFLDWDTIYDMTLLVKHFVEHYVAHPTTRRTRA